MIRKSYYQLKNSKKIIGIDYGRSFINKSAASSWLSAESDIWSSHIAHSFINIRNKNAILMGNLFTNGPQCKKNGSRICFQNLCTDIMNE